MTKAAEEWAEWLKEELEDTQAARGKPLSEFYLEGVQWGLEQVIGEWLEEARRDKRRRRR